MKSITTILKIFWTSTKQDSTILNIQRACEASIDLAMHFDKERKLGLPKTSRSKLIDANLANSLMNMVGFRNIAVHDYQAFEKTYVILKDFIK